MVEADQQHITGCLTMIRIDIDEPVDLMESLYINGGLTRTFARNHPYALGTFAWTSFFVFELMLGVILL